MTTFPGSVDVGDELPELVLAPLTRHALALYCGASGDHNPLHTDIDFARSAGLPDVIGHGMLSMAWLGRMLTGWAPQRCLRSYGVRFVAPTQIGDVITCSGRVTEKTMVEGEARVRITVAARKGDGTVVLAGDAEVALV